MTAALVRQRRRLALATVAIALAVGYLAGALTLLDRVSGGLNELASAGGDKSDVVVEGEVAYQSSLEQVRRLVPISVGASLASVDGIASVSPLIEDVATIVTADGKPIVPLGLSEQPLGANWPDDSSIARYEVVSGKPPQGSDQVAIDRRSAAAAGLEVGDEVKIVGKAKEGMYTISAIVDTRGGLPPGSSLALVSTSEARVLFDRPLEDNTVGIRVAPGADPQEVEDSIRRILPPGIEVVDGATAAVHRQESLTRSFTLIRGLILGFAGLALIVGMITVANSLSLLYSERRRTLASLRLVGAKSSQLLTACLIEAALLAGVASLIGAPIGLLLGRLIESAFGALGTSVPVAGSAISWSALAWAFGIGVLTTVLAAVLPASRACRVAPVEAVTEAAAPDPRPARRVLVLASLAGVAVGAATAGLLWWTNGQGAPDSAGMSAATIGALAAAAAVISFAIVTFPMAISTLVSLGIRMSPSRSGRTPSHRGAGRDEEPVPHGRHRRSPDAGHRRGRWPRRLPQFVHRDGQRRGRGPGAIRPRDRLRDLHPGWSAVGPAHHGRPVRFSRRRERVAGRTGNAGHRVDPTDRRRRDDGGARDRPPFRGDGAGDVR